jgi:hypothetical protein
MLRGALVHFDLRFRKENNIYGWYYGTCVYINESLNIWDLSCYLELVNLKIVLVLFFHLGRPPSPLKRLGLRKYITIQLLTTKPTNTPNLFTDSEKKLGAIHRNN